MQFRLSSKISKKEETLKFRTKTMTRKNLVNDTSM